MITQKIKIAIITAIVGVLTITAFYLYYTSNNLKIETLNKDIVVLEEKYDKAVDIIVDLEAKNIVQSRELSKLHMNNSIARSENVKLSNILSKHDIKYLASQKPKLVENRINEGTKKVLKELEEITRRPDE